MAHNPKVNGYAHPNTNPDSRVNKRRVNAGVRGQRHGVRRDSSVRTPMRTQPRQLGLVDLGRSPGKNCGARAVGGQSGVGGRLGLGHGYS